MNLAILAFLAASAIRPGGDMRDASMRPNRGSTASVTIDALPYTRTVTASSYTLTGTYSNFAPATWSASPSGSSGACSDLGAGNFSCVVTVTPDATGEGVETIAIGNGSVTLGFYVAGAHTAFLSQNVNGSYNVGLIDLDAVTTWENVGTSALDVTQTGAASLKPTFKTACFGSASPCVRFDGGDSFVAALASDWTFLNNGTDTTVMIVAKTSAADPNAAMTMVATSAGLLNPAARGFGVWYDDRVGVSKNNSTNVSLTSGVITNIDASSGNGDFPAQTWVIMETVLDDDFGTGTDFYTYDSNAAVGSATNPGAYSASAPGGPLTVGDIAGGSAFKWNGDISDVLIYQSALTDVQRGINQAVADWASGGSQITPATSTWVLVGDSLTAGSGGVTNWPTKLLADVPAGTWLSNRAVGGAIASQILTQWRKSALGKVAKVFVLGGVNDIAVGTSAATAFASLSPIYSEASALGLQVIAMPTPPFGNFSLWSAPDQVQLLLLEDSILADGNVDVIVNFYDLMGQPGTPEDLAAIYDNGDGIHPNDAGTTFMAAQVAAALGL